MRTDVAGRVKNTSLAASRPLLPLYEAVVNSIQAIQDAFQTDGRIDIDILRDDQHLFTEEDPSFGDIIGFEVTDNGIGFNEENYRAFDTADTTYKAQRGGKGVGRFLWLVAFDRVEIASDFHEDGKAFRRNFEFVPSGDGVRNMTIAEAGTAERTTVVRLSGFRQKFQEQCPKRVETIAIHLIEHLLEYFIRPDCPAIGLRDRHTNESLALNEIFAGQIARQSTRDDIQVDDYWFHVLHVRLYSTHVREHQVHYCADGRVVKSDRLLGQVANLTRHLQDEEGRDFVYAAYVDGVLLDESVNAERTDFTIIDDEGQLFVATITWRSIRAAIFRACQQFLTPYTDPIRKRKKEHIEDFVASEAPMYRPILSHIEEKLDLIDPEISDDALELKLYQAYQELQVEVRDQGRELLDKDVPDQEWEEFARQLDEYFDKVSDVNKSDLARYV